MAFTDLLLALPGLPLYALILTLIGPSQVHVAVLLGVLSWPSFARVVRAQVIAVRTAPYIEAVRGLGGTGGASACGMSCRRHSACCPRTWY